MYIIVFYVPVESCQLVKQAMFTAGAGQLGDYDSCAWQVLGQGQFRPLTGSKPTIGEIDQVESLDEFRVEMVCAEHAIEQVIRALKKSHPYEEVAYHVVKTIDI